MASEQDILRDVIIQLRADNEKLVRNNAALRITTNSDSQPNPPEHVRDPPAHVPQTRPSGTTTERLLFVPRERECPMFRGDTGMGIVEWVEEVRASMRARRLAPIDQAFFIYDHLEGPAKEEIGLYPKSDREDPEKVIAILQEEYGCQRSYVALQKDFFSRKQAEGESLREYSHALFNLMEKMVRNAPHGVPNSAILLRDQFVEYVLDGNLSRALKETVRAHPSYGLLDIRNVAIRWVREGRLQDGGPRSCSAHPTYTRTQVHDRPETLPTQPPFVANMAPTVVQFMWKICFVFFFCLSFLGLFW